MVNFASSTLWHEIPAHVNEMGVVEMFKITVVRGEPSFLRMEAQNAQLKHFVKHTEHLFQKCGSFDHALGLFDVIHTCVCGPIETRSIKGARYFIIIIDRHSPRTTFFPMRNKSETKTYYL